MTSTPRTPAEHYGDAESALAALPALGLDAEERIAEAIVALTHATLALASPRRARPRRTPVAVAGRRHHGGSPRERWIHGHDDTEGG